LSPLTPFRRWLANLALVCGGVLAALLIAEIALRAAGVSFPIFYTPDAERGWALPAGTTGWYRDEGESYVRINSDGLHDRKHAKTKPPNTIRIAVLGDSFAEAMQVPRRENFCSVMEQELNHCDAFQEKTVEVINFGVGGYTTSQELITLRDHAWTYSPDIVVLALCWSNDVEENSRALDNFPYHPYFVYRGDSLVLDDSFRHDESYRIHSFFWSLIPNSRVIETVKRAKDLYIQDRVRKQFEKEYPALRALGGTTRPEEYEVYDPPASPAWKEAWRVTEGLIKLMHDEVTERGATFLVAIQDDDIQVYPDPAFRERARKALGSPDLFYPNQRFRAFFDREGIQYVDLGPPFQKNADEHHVFLHGFANTPPGLGHWNAAGQHLAGELIAQKICEDRKQESAPSGSRHEGSGGPPLAGTPR
jgi:hypothetical protein